MKKLNKYILFLLALTVIVPACKDEDLVTLPEWQSAVHAYAEFTPTGDPDVDPVSNFKNGNPSVVLSFDFLWNSIDGKNTVNKIEIYAYFSEAYVDPDGNPATAAHGGADGRLLMTLDGASVPSDKETTTFTISQSDIYEIYKDAAFDYDKDGTATPVWSNPDKPDRDTDDYKFIPGDSFSIQWKLTTDDGRVFDSWSPSVCTEFPGANCSVGWTIVCAESIEQPVGDWTFNLQDLYGDGWQGGYISVIVDGAEATQVNIPDYWTTGEGPYSALTAVVTIPDGTTSLSFAWSVDSYQAECAFTIVSPRGNVVADLVAPPAGPIQLDLCKE